MTRANGVESGRRPDTPWLSVVRYTLLTSKPGPAYFNEHMLSSELIVQLSEQHVATAPVCEFFIFKRHRAARVYIVSVGLCRSIKFTGTCAKKGVSSFVVAKVVFIETFGNDHAMHGRASPS